MRFTSSLPHRVYELLRTVPCGRVTTYKALAQAAGTKSYRAIGQILKRNPDAPNTPCHRVVASDGTIGGFMGQTRGKEIQKKIGLLNKEGVHLRGNTILDFDKILYTFHRS